MEGIEDEIEEKYGLEDQNDQDNSRISLFEEAENVQNGISFADSPQKLNCQMQIDSNINEHINFKEDENMEIMCESIQDK